MTELREKVARLIIDFIEAPDAREECTAEEFGANVDALADAILEIPEIRNALELKRAFTISPYSHQAQSAGPDPRP